MFLVFEDHQDANLRVRSSIPGIHPPNIGHSLNGLLSLNGRKYVVIYVEFYIIKVGWQLMFGTCLLTIYLKLLHNVLFISLSFSLNRVVNSPLYNSFSAITI